MLFGVTRVVAYTTKLNQLLGKGNTMKTLADRFRQWYEYERDCNGKSLEMLTSVPDNARCMDDFRTAIEKLAHLVAARRRWLHRLGVYRELSSSIPTGVTLDALRHLVAETESAWVTYLIRLVDADLTQEIEWETMDGTRLRWEIESVLVQTFGHAWYHRGQIAMLVSKLGGRAVDTDYYFWSPPSIIQD
jgi:uncharacterized damage-inducible protein DinB